MELCLIMNLFSFVMIYLIYYSPNQEKKSCGGLYQMNQMKIYPGVKQQRNVMTGSKIRKGVLTKNQPRILFRYEAH